MLNILNNKLLFVLRRYSYNENEVSLAKDLIFIDSFKVAFSNYFIILKVILKRSFKFTIKNVFSTTNTLTLIKYLIKKDSLVTNSFDSLNILEINTIAFYKLVKNKTNNLFIITLSEKYKELLILAILVTRDLRILINSSYSYKFKIKYKRYYKFYIVIYIYNIKILTLDKVKKKFSEKYYNYLNVLDRIKANELSSYFSYNYKLKFIENANKIKLSRSRIYLIVDRKLDEVKKYLNEYLKKNFIVFS